MELYGSLTSPYVRHCRIALMQSQLSFKLILTDQTQSAQLIATQRVPFLKDRDVTLSDSASILRYIREKSGQTFLNTVEEFDKFCFVNTVLDSTANLFYLEKFGLDQQANAYTQRQNNRIHGSLLELENSLLSFQAVNDWHLRLACFLDWAIFRHRIQADNYPNLCQFLQQAQQYKIFALTHPTE